MFGRPKVTMNDESVIDSIDVRGTHIAADRVENVFVTLVDYNPGSRLEGRLTSIEGKLDAALPKMDVEGRLLYAPWRIIDDDTPKDDPIMVFEGFEDAMCKAWWDPEDKEWRHAHGRFWRQPTHWKPLPERPTSEGSKP